jgi:two-component system sensor histidine kinase BaeS
LKTEQLWQKLALAFILVALSTIVAAYLLLNFVIDTHFEGYVNQHEKQVYERIGLSLAAAYIDSGGWDNQVTESLPHFAVMNRIYIEVRNADGNLIAKAPFGDDPTQNHRLFQQLGVSKVDVIKSKLVEVPILVRNHRVGSISVAPLTIPGELTGEQQFRISLNRSLAAGGLLATLAAFIISYLISTRMTRSLTSITRAAKNLENGDLGQRVQVDADDEIGQLGEAFNHLAETLEYQERMRKNLTADVAHELRTPLAVIRSHIEAYMDGVMKPDPENLGSIHEEIMRLGRLVNDLAELSKAESGGLELKTADIDLAETVEKVAAGLRPLFQEKNIDLKLDLEPNTVGSFEEDKIRQVAVNLIGNAIKFTPPGGQVQVSVGSQGDDTVVMSVTDTGIGIDEQSLSHIFERFYRIEKSRNRATGGSGIGLTIAAELVKLHGGSISVASKPGEGSTFTVVLPKNRKKMKIHNSRIFSS